MPGRPERLEQEPEDVGVLLVLRGELVLPVPVRALDHVAGTGEGRRRHGLAVGTGREGDGAADVVVVHVGDHHGVDRVRRGPGLAEDIEQAARRAHPPGPGSAGHADPRVDEHHATGVADQPRPHLQLPAAVVGPVHARRAIAEREQLLGGRVGEHVGDRSLELPVGVEERQQFEVTHLQRVEAHPRSLGGRAGLPPRPVDRSRVR